MQLILGTTNPAKQQMLRSALAPLGLVLRGADELGLLQDVDETGTTALENARLKAQAYSTVAGRAVLSMDNALYLDGLPLERQPGVHTRRIPEHDGRATDDELLRYYVALVEELGGRVDGYWEFGVCLVDDRGRFHETVLRSPRIFDVRQYAEGVGQRIPGYPLESIQLDPASGRPIADLSAEEQDAWWREMIGPALCAFVEAALAEGS